MDWQLIFQKTMGLTLIWLCVWGGVTSFVMYHEQGHYQINKYNNIDSKIKINDFGLSGQTIPEYHACMKTNDECRGVYAQQSIHESIGYTLGPMWIMTLIFGGIYCSIKLK